MMKWCNDNHWYLIAGMIVAVLIFWAYGCQSQVKSIMYPEQQVNRSELQNELVYLVGLAKSRTEDLDRQDESKQALLDAATVIGSTGSINPAGLVNIAATVVAIGFGLKKRQEVNVLTKNSA